MELCDDGGLIEQHLKEERIRSKIEALNVELRIEQDQLNKVEFEKNRNHELLQFGILYLVLGILGMAGLLICAFRINSSPTAVMFVAVFLFTVAVWREAVYKFFMPLYIEYLWKSEKAGKTVTKPNLEKVAREHSERIRQIRKQIDGLRNAPDLADMENENR